MYMDSCHKILDDLYLGSAAALHSKQRFSTIVNCTLDISFPKYCKNCIRIPIDDDVNHSTTFLTFIQETRVLEKIHHSRMIREPVLVHCYAGIQRSCTLVACYLIAYCFMKPVEAVRYIQSKRNIAFLDNVSFLSVIESFYENQLE
jgi:protein-tyrosine phosphatase